jgi:hypothetical protein
VVAGGHRGPAQGPGRREQIWPPLEAECPLRWLSTFWDLFR